MTIVDSPSEQSTAVDPQLLFREARQRRRRRRWLIAGIAGVVLVIVVSSVMLIGRATGRGAPTQGTGRVPAPVAGARSFPKQMVVVDGASPNLQVISSATGHVLRNLTSEDGSFGGGPGPRATVSPAGIVYFDHAGQAGSHPSEQIWSIPVWGGQITYVADGHTPVVSPNGALLAYLTWTGLTNAPASVVVMNIATGAIATWTYSTTVPELWGLSWAPNSQSLVFTASPSTNPSSNDGAWSIQLSNPNRSLDAAQPLRLLPNAFWVGYVNSTQAMEVLQQQNFLGQGDWFQPILIDVASGQVVKRLPAIAGQSGSDAGAWQIDPTGRYVAFIRARRLPNGAGFVTDVYRSSINPAPQRPTIVRRDAASPTWVPGS